MVKEIVVSLLSITLFNLSICTMKLQKHYICTVINNLIYLLLLDYICCSRDKKYLIKKMIYAHISSLVVKYACVKYLCWPTAYLEQVRLSHCHHCTVFRFNLVRLTS